MQITHTTQKGQGVCRSWLLSSSCLYKHGMPFLAMCDCYLSHMTYAFPSFPTILWGQQQSLCPETTIPLSRIRNKNRSLKISGFTEARKKRSCWDSFHNTIHILPEVRWGVGHACIHTSACMCCRAKAAFKIISMIILQFDCMYYQSTYLSSTYSLCVSHIHTCYSYI